MSTKLTSPQHFDRMSIPYTVAQFASTKRLPTLPKVAAKLIELAQQDDPNPREVARVISADPVISGRVLTTVNSALLALRPKVVSIEDAVVRLGINLIRMLMLSFYLADYKSPTNANTGFWLNHWRSSLTQAVFAELIADELAEKKQLDPASCFLAALLQDIGILAMLSEAPDEYQQHVLNHCKFPNVESAERSHFGFSHIDVSLEIIKSLGLGDCFSPAIADHHNYLFAEIAESENSMPLICKAATLGAAVVLGEPHKRCVRDSTMEWFEFTKHRFGFTAETSRELLSECNRLVGEYSSVFRFDIGDGMDADQMVELAKGTLAELAIESQMEVVAVKNSFKTNEDVVYNTDELSGLRNRKYFNEHVTRKIEFCVQKRRPIAVVFLDVDNFKRINDTYGHYVGDNAIAHIGHWLKETIRDSDIAIRLGGDEFVVIFENIKESQFKLALERIVSAIPPMPFEDKSIEINLSAGGVFYTPKRGDTPDANWLIDQADRLMYSAKKKKNSGFEIKKILGRQPVAKTYSAD